MSIKRIAFFASGSGSNVENIVTYFREKDISIEFLVLCNNPSAYVLERAKNLKIESHLFDKKALRETGAVLERLNNFGPDLIVLAGFLLLMPEEIVKAFPKKIINIHPALLPKFGGKGMYGQLVHEAVVEKRETHSGITIHYVNEHYDKGEFIFQAECQVLPNDGPNDVAAKVHALEYKHYPKVIEEVLFTT